MLAAVVKVTGIIPEKEFLQDMEGSFKHKFAKKPEVIGGNMKALEIALQRVVEIQQGFGDVPFFPILKISNAITKKLSHLFT